MKKIMALLLCAVMLASVLVGCGTPAVEQGPLDNDSKFNVEAPADYTLTIGLPANTMVEDYETNAFTLWLEKELGHNISFVKYNTLTADYQAQVATEFMVPGQEMPDILFGMSLTQHAVDAYYDAGLIYNLAPYFNDPEKGKIWWDRLNEIPDPELIQFCTDKLYVEGKEDIYIFPTFEYNTYDQIRHQAFINQEWLDKLNLPMPTNIDELYNTLVAFKNQDPNGNNKKDEIPLISAGMNSFGDAISWITNMFCYQEDARPWRVDENGTISGFFWDDKYREALIFLNKLVKEGLMPDAILTTDNNDLTSLINPVNDLQTVGIFLGHPTLVMTEGSKVVDIFKAMPQWGNVVMNVAAFRWDGAIVTKDCEYPDLAWDFLMLLCTEEGAYHMRYGEKGVDWVDATPGSKAFTGLDAEINVLNHNAFGGKGNSTWNTVMATIGISNENEQTEVSDSLSAWNKKKLDMMGECYKANWDNDEKQGGRPKNVVMPLIYNAEEEVEVSIFRNNTQNWFKTNRADFIKGVKDPNDDAQWQAYIDGFKTANYYDWLEIAQDIYEYTYGSKSGK